MTEGSVQQQVGGTYKIIKEDGWWIIQQKMRDVVGDVLKMVVLKINLEIFSSSGHHKVEMNRAVMGEVYTTMYKFDEVSRNIAEFQERCDEYQTDVNNVLLAALPVVINKVIFSELILLIKLLNFIKCYVILFPSCIRYSNLCFALDSRQHI